MEPLRNPETLWSRTATPTTIDHAEVERRVGPTTESIEVLSGGFANLNLRVGRERVLRIKRDALTVAKELALLSRPWRTFRTPSALSSGDDFLVLEYLALAPLPPTAGAAVGSALAEIHATTYPEMGLLAGTFRSPSRSTRAWAVTFARLTDAEPFIDAALVARA